MIVVLIFSRLTDLQNNNIVMMKEVMGRFFGSKDEINRRYEPIPGKIDNHWAIFVSLLSAGIFSFGLNIAILGLFRSPNKNDIYIDLYYPTAVTVVLGVFFLYFVLSIYAKTVSLGGARELIQSVIKSRNR